MYLTAGQKIVQKSLRNLEDSEGDENGGGYRYESSRERRAKRKADKESKL